MNKKLLVVYQFATFGGVERVLLNRAAAFKYYNKNYKLYLYFYEDYGAKEALKSYISKHDLNDYIEIVDELHPKEYDAVISIDTPQIFKHPDIDPSEVYMETHTFEKKYREYLNTYINKIKKLIVPSSVFYNIILADYKIQDKNKVKIVTNFVPWNIQNSQSENISLPKWNKNIVFYIGRMDDNKNVKELVKGFKEYLKKDDSCLLLLIGKLDPGYYFKEFLEQEKINNRVVLLPPIPFDKTDILFNSLKPYNPVFVSSSKGETFSLSAAEAFSHDIPVLLSNISAHKELVKNNDKFLYDLGDDEELAEKLENIYSTLNNSIKEIKQYKNAISAEQFIKDWDAIFEDKK